MLFITLGAWSVSHFMAHFIQTKDVSFDKFIYQFSLINQNFTKICTSIPNRNKFANDLKKWEPTTLPHALTRMQTQTIRDSTVSTSEIQCI